MSRRPDPVAAEIVAIATACHDLPAVAAATRGCRACPALVDSRTRVVPGDFPGAATILLIGEAPGAQEDVAGRPFVGKAGALLDQLLAECGIDRAAVAVANVCNCRPPGNRAPTVIEARRCAGWLDRQIDLLDPAIVVSLGRTALTWALGPEHRLADVRGVAHPWRSRRLVATYHPSAAIRFGPAGAPRAALRADLEFVAGLAAAAA